jgi:nitrogen fixation protein FixH
LKKEKNYYAIGLLIFGTLFVTGLAYMLKIAFSTPVEMENSRMMSYREFDGNYNQIVEKQKAFDAAYTVSFGEMKFQKDAPSKIDFNVTSKNANAVKDANVTILLTRPDSSKNDIKLTEFAKNGNSYTSKEFKLTLPGRWKIVYRVQIGDAEKFIDLETFVNK